MAPELSPLFPPEGTALEVMGGTKVVEVAGEVVDDCGTGLVVGVKTDTLVLVGVGDTAIDENVVEDTIEVGRVPTVMPVVAV